MATEEPLLHGGNVSRRMAGRRWLAGQAAVRRLRNLTPPMNYFDAIILGIVEGLTEFLPISCTGHLTIAEKMLGLQVDDPAVTAYTAVIQMGAIAAVLLYFRQDIWRIAVAWCRGLSSRSTAATSTTASAGTSSSARSPSASSASSART